MNELFVATLRQDIADIKKMLTQQLAMSQDLLEQIKKLNEKQPKKEASK